MRTTIVALLLLAALNPIMTGTTLEEPPVWFTGADGVEVIVLRTTDAIAAIYGLRELAIVLRRLGHSRAAGLDGRP